MISLTLEIKNYEHDVCSIVASTCHKEKSEVCHFLTENTQNHPMTILGFGVSNNQIKLVSVVIWPKKEKSHHILFTLLSKRDDNTLIDFSEILILLTHSIL